MKDEKGNQWKTKKQVIRFSLGRIEKKVVCAKF